MQSLTGSFRRAPPSSCDLHMPDEAWHQNLVVCELDVTSEESWDRAVNLAVDHLGGLDILVNNAGILRTERLVDESLDAFEQTWRVNCLGPFLGMRARAHALREGVEPAIVNIESTAAAQAWPHHAAYVSSKWALRGLTQVAALDFSPYRIRVNAVLPGPIATPMMLPGDNRDAGVHARFAGLPVGRMGEPGEVADAVMFLASRAGFVHHRLRAGRGRRPAHRHARTARGWECPVTSSGDGEMIS